MPDQFKLLDPTKDIVTQTIPVESSLYTLTGSTDATAYNTRIYTIGPSALSYVPTPDSLGSTTVGISPSGAINSITKRDFDRYGSQYLNPGLNIYTLPASHTANVNVSTARVIEVLQPTEQSGIWPDTVTAQLTYNGTTITVVDVSALSFGPNKESLTYGKLTDITNPQHVLGSIFYDDAMILLHGGTGNVGNAITSSSVTGFAFVGSLTGGLSASTSASHIIINSISFRTYAYQTQNIYSCVAEMSEFNYTSNPSAQFSDFLQNPQNATVYITTIGLYNDKDELLAVAKVSPPVRKNQYLPRVFLVTLAV